MNLSFLKREKEKGKIEWGIITPIYLMAIRDGYGALWSEFVRMIKAIDDHSLDKALDKIANKKTGGPNEKELV